MTQVSTATCSNSNKAGSSKRRYQKKGHANQQVPTLEYDAADEKADVQRHVLKWETLSEMGLVRSPIERYASAQLNAISTGEAP